MIEGSFVKGAKPDCEKLKQGRTQLQQQTSTEAATTTTTTQEPDVNGAKGLLQTELIMMK
jgi:hypothetical protein